MTPFPSVGRSVYPRALYSLLFSKYSLLSVFAGILLCKAEGLGHLSPTTGLGSIWCFHRGGRPDSGSEPKPGRPQGQAESAGCCWAVGLLSPEAVPAGSGGGGRDRPLSPGLGVGLPGRSTSLHRSPSGRRGERERVSRDQRWESGQAWLGGRGEPGCRSTWSRPVDSVPRSHDSGRWVSWAPCLRGGSDRPPRPPPGVQWAVWFAPETVLRTRVSNPVSAELGLFASVLASAGDVPVRGSSAHKTCLDIW